MATDDPTIAETPRSASRRALTQPPERYTIVALLGEGGMGRVYRAHDTTLGRDVAIKMIDHELHGPDKTHERERFVREAKAAARLVHPNIAVVHDVDADAGWLVMELVDGETLRALVGRGPLGPARVRSIAEQVLGALDAAHAAGVIHRDIKPSNIVVAPSGAVKLVDFGVARLVDIELTKPGENVGTPAYMAPEQLRGGAIDARTDLYALGGTLYELVTGDRMVAFESPDDAALTKVRDACGSDTALATVIATCLQANPDARYPSARDALAALGGSTTARPSRRRRWPLVLALAGVLAASGVAFALARLHRTEPGDPRLAKAFTLAQRGENEKASNLLEEILAEDPRNPDATAYKILVDWWEGGNIIDVGKRVGDIKLSHAQRAMVKGIDLITQRRETEAVGYLSAQDREHPGEVEILYALGEAQWHGQQLEAGVDTLERAFMRDPRWQVALHHVIEYWLSRGDARQLVPIADTLRAVDPPAAETLDCKIAIGNREYKRASEIAAGALARMEKTPELYICLAQADALLGRFEDGEKAAKSAFELWPIDAREWGGFAQYAEFLLYAGTLDAYLDLLRGKPSRQRALALMLWRPEVPTDETQPSGPGMRMPPLGAATWILQEKLKGHDAVDVYGDYVEPEVRAYGQALWAEQRGDVATAISLYRTALAVPAKGDMRMLLAHHLARALVSQGKVGEANTICDDEIRRPRMYQPYRAIVLRDCDSWELRR